jgi:hypothetical protein
MSPRATEAAAILFLIHFVGRAGPCPLFDEPAQNGVRRGRFLGPFRGARRTLCAT